MTVEKYFLTAFQNCIKMIFLFLILKSIMRKFFFVVVVYFSCGNHCMLSRILQTLQLVQWCMQFVQRGCSYEALEHQLQSAASHCSQLQYS